MRADPVHHDRRPQHRPLTRREHRQLLQDDARRAAARLVLDQLIQPEPLKIVVERHPVGRAVRTAAGRLRPGQMVGLLHRTQRDHLLHRRELRPGRADACGGTATPTSSASSPPAKQLLGRVPRLLRRADVQHGRRPQHQRLDIFCDNSGGNCRLYGRITITDDGHTITVKFHRLGRRRTRWPGSPRPTRSPARPPRPPGGGLVLRPLRTRTTYDNSECELPRMAGPGITEP